MADATLPLTFDQPRGLSLLCARVLFLTSHEAKFITGVVLPVDGGRARGLGEWVRGGSTGSVELEYAAKSHTITPTKETRHGLVRARD